ncbi:MAG: FAD/NAD(P)-binding oxidoreductase [Propionicimonas sp.]|nr:FAD/NAD(P)-binding oxidoreductase [Propionicimonas sp.]
MKRLVVLGGGTAGTMVANRLRAALEPHELHLTVVDRDDAHHYQPGYLFMPFGSYTTTDIVRSRHRFLADGIDLVLTGIDRVDPAHRTVHLGDGRTLGYDYLVVATGVSPRPDATPGMQGALWGDRVHEFYSLPGAQALTEAIRRFRGGRLVVHVTEMPIKCPVAPLEFAFLADDWLRRHRIRDRTTLTYVTPLDGAFTKPVASRELATALTDRQIGLETDFAIDRVDNETAELVSYDGRRIGFDLLVTVPLNMGADWVARSGMGDELNLVPCDQHTMASLAHPDVFVLGDAGTLQTSKAGSVAHFAVDVFVDNFLDQFHGRPPGRGFDGHANCFIEAGGHKGMLLDFNYTTEPFTGTFPLPVVGPFRLLRESRLNHLGKLAFRWVYWNLLLPGRPLPLIPTAMSMAGKRVEKDVAATATGLPGAPEPSSPTPVRLPIRSSSVRPLPPRPAHPRPAPPHPAPPRPSPVGMAAAPADGFPDRPGIDSTADPATVLPDPIIPRF